MYNEGVISVIVPCYNGEKHIERFMNAILQQTYKKIELIIINDGSTDKSEQLIKKYISKLNNEGVSVKYVSQNNAGLGCAIQKALNMVEGEFFTWFGIDDWPVATYMQRAIEYLSENLDVGVVRFDGYLVDENDLSNILGLFAENNHDKYNPYMFENAIDEKNFHFGYSVIRTKCFDNANCGRNIYVSREGQNWQLLLPVFYYYKAGFIDEPLYYVIEHSNSVSRCATTYEKKIKQIKEYQNILLNTIGKLNIPEKNKYLNRVNLRYAHRFFAWAMGEFDFEFAKQNYIYLKKHHDLSRQEIKRYKRRVASMEYWIYLKNKLTRN